jgi:predicted transcriptional regulator
MTPPSGSRRNLALSDTPALAVLGEYLRDNHDVTVVVDEVSNAAHRLFDPQNMMPHPSRKLEPGQQAFQLATQIAVLGSRENCRPWSMAQDSQTLRLVGSPVSASPTIFAGGLIMPYGRFLAAAKTLRYDIELLLQEFGVGFETVCHWLSTLQRPSARGVPFFLIRVDRAGNISRRRLATDFHFLPAVECLRSVREPGPHPEAACPSARRTYLPLRCPHPLPQKPRLWIAEQDLRRGSGMRHQTRGRACLFARIG